MKRWALVVVALYILVLTALFLPAILLTFSERWDLIREFFLEGSIWFGFGVMLLAQVLLLVLPARIESRRPVTRGALWPTIITAGFLLAALLLGAAMSVIEFFLSGAGEPTAMIWTRIALAFVSWIIWSMVFHRMSKQGLPRDFVSRTCRWLFVGSVLELLIAVPTHVVARHRNYCCAGIYTGIGLATGLAVMVLAYGPALFFLFIARWRRLHPNPPAP